MFINTHS